MRDYYYDFDGNTIDMQAWIGLRDDARWRVDVTEIKQNLTTYTVSTIWVGMDLLPMTKTKPHIYETMVFTDDEDDKWHEYVARYSTRDAAIAGHLRIVRDIEYEKSPFED